MPSPFTCCRPPTCNPNVPHAQRKLALTPQFGSHISPVRAVGYQPTNPTCPRFRPSWPQHHGLSTIFLPLRAVGYHPTTTCPNFIPSWPQHHRVFAIFLPVLYLLYVTDLLHQHALSSPQVGPNTTVCLPSFSRCKL